MAAPKPQRRHNPTLIIGGLLLLSALIGWTVLPWLWPAGKKLSGGPAPDFSLPIIANGEPQARMRLSELGGSVVVLDFWATYCEPCAVQSAILERVARKHPEGVVVLGISVDEDPKLAREYARQKSLSYPILSDPDGAVQGSYGVQALPSLVVVSPDGKVADFVQGVVGEEALTSTIASLR